MNAKANLVVGQGEVADVASAEAHLGHVVRHEVLVAEGIEPEEKVTLMLHSNW